MKLSFLRQRLVDEDYAEPQRMVANAHEGLPELTADAVNALEGKDLTFGRTRRVAVNSGVWPS